MDHFSGTTEDMMADNLSWDSEDLWWERNYRSRPYSTGLTYE